MSRYLFVDTETGGLNPENSSILSIGMIIWEDFQVIFEDDFYIKDEPYRVSEEAMRINKIKLDEVAIKGISRAEAVKRIVGMIHDYFPDTKAVIAGHNIQFDVKFIKKLFEGEGMKYHNFFSHRVIDTSSIIRFLSDAKYIPNNLESSDKAFEYFDIVINKRHSALGDIKGTVLLYEKLLKLI